jgi:hypothetical protein
MNRQRHTIPLGDEPPLTRDERALLRTLTKAISTSAKPVERPRTKLLQIGRQFAAGPWVEVTFDWPQSHLHQLVDLLTAVGRVSDSELNSLATDLAVLLVDNGWKNARATEYAAAFVKKWATKFYGRRVPRPTTARNLAKNLKRKL